MSKRLNRFLIAANAEATTRQFSCLGRRLGYTTLSVAGLEQFGTALADFDPTFVLVDLQSVAGGGLDHLKAMRDAGCDAQVMLTDDTTSRALETARQLAGFLGLATVASVRSPVFGNLLQNELRKARQLQSELTLGVCAEAVDSRRTLKFIGAAGCDMAQGTAICKPLAARALETRLP